MQTTQHAAPIDFGPILLSFDPDLLEKIKGSVAQWTAPIKATLEKKTTLTIDPKELDPKLSVEIKDQVDMQRIDSLITQSIDYVKLKRELNDPVDTAVRQASEDILGAYCSEAHQIELYWHSIGLIARLKQLDATSLTFVVLAHQLARAYIHAGHDFDQAEHRSNIATAQFYTLLVCQELRGADSNEVQVFNNLMKIQSEA